MIFLDIASEANVEVVQSYVTHSEKHLSNLAVIFLEVSFLSCVKYIFIYSTLTIYLLGLLWHV